MPNFISEDQIEKALLKELRKEYKYEVLNCYTDNPEDLKDRSGRADKREVILRDRLYESVTALNPLIPKKTIVEAIEQLLSPRLAMSLVAANKEIYNLLRDGVPVEYENEKGEQIKGYVKIIDFSPLANNQLLAVSQLWVKGELGFCRPDVILYVNGVPLVFIELKNSNVKLKTAFEDNLTKYKELIPQLFYTNAFCVLSNAIETRIGSITSEWEHFFNWLRVSDTKEKVNRKLVEKKGTSLESIIKGLFQPKLLLDYVENFILFYKDTQKIIGQNHQFIGVNSSFDTFVNRTEKQGRLGVFWHTQGSGKSFSMIFYVRKIFRKLTGNFTFVVVTDRDDLDGQIYRNFLNTGTVTKAEAAQPKDSEEMRKFLGQNKRLVFTLIQKFRWDKGKEYPLLSSRDDIIVMVDEAHRSQYRTFAENMRAGLPKAQYLAFTGTPLLGRKRKTNAWFGDYVSEYTFQQSVDDGSTKPLIYSKRVPEVLIQNKNLNEEFYEILEDENLDDLQQEKLEKEFATEVEVIKRDDRLETIAKDIVDHFPRRGYLGKGVVISLDKFTAVKMYDKVQRYWKERIKELHGLINNAQNEDERTNLKKMLDYMRSVEMAVVISEEADEEKKFAKQKLDIKPHRDRMNYLDSQGHDIEYNFKEEPNHPLQLVFVCAMWLTGFDAPTISTMYLDKPMKDHTLMQAIARANRVTSWKINGVEKEVGEIVDYFNVFRNMRKALKEYALGSEESTQSPLFNKNKLLVLLQDSIKQAKDFCIEKKIHIDVVMRQNDIFKNISTFEEYANRLLSKDDWWKGFKVYENTITSLYEACKPEILGNPIVRSVAVFQYLREVVDGIIEQKDLDEAGKRIGQLLDESLIVDKSKITHPALSEFTITHSSKTWDLSKLDFAKLKKEFKTKKYKNIEITDLRAFIEHKMQQMLQQNTTRIDFAQRYQAIIDQYNSGSSSADHYFDELLNYMKSLKQEDERAHRENLSEDELEIYDLLKKDKITKEETQKVKLAAKSLLQRLTKESPKVLVQDWFKDVQTRQMVKSAVTDVLDKHLPKTYNRSIFQKKCEIVYDHVFQLSNRGERWAA